MPYEIKLVRHERNWVTSHGVSVTGAAFNAGGLLQGDTLAAYFAQCRDSAEFINAVEAVNGFFAVVCEQGGLLYAAVDRTRSIPLFYGTRGSSLFLSNDAEWVRERVADEVRSSVSEAEFLLTGYVTGGETLYPRVRQLQAGELLMAEVDERGVRLRTHRYYRYQHNADHMADSELIQGLDEAVTRSVQRLVDYANHRTIVVPLSGGYDSRLILSTLTRLGYDKLLAFTYGLPGTKEVVISSQVARSLGVKWEYVQYSVGDWWRWFHSQERERYFRSAHNAVSVPHIQDWPAVWELIRRGKLPEDAVFAPGHSGDFLAGSHIPEALLDRREVSGRDIVEAVMRHHFCLWKWSEIPSDVAKVLKRRLACEIGVDTDYDAESAVSLFEEWDWRERQSKFIVNSVRVYEFWGHDWWLPLWDLELMQFWSRVPLSWRVGERLYIDYVTAVYTRTAGLPAYAARKSDRKLLATVLDRYPALGRAKRLIKRTMLFRLVQKLRARQEAKRVYEGHPMGWYGVMSANLFTSLYTGSENVNSFLAKEILGMLSL